MFDFNIFKEDQKEIEKAINLADKRGELTEQDWWGICLHTNALSEKFITDHRDKMNWTFICCNTERQYSEQFLIDNFSWIPWSIIIKHQKILTPKFISGVFNKLGKRQWGDLTRMRLLDENLIKKYRYSVDWRTICSSMKLSTSFMREMRDFLDWYDISAHQMLTPNFMREFRDKINFNVLVQYSKIKIPKKLQKEFLGEVINE